MVNRMADFLNLVFLITLPKMITRTYKIWAVSMRLDVSYNLCSKLGSKLIFFWDDIMAILVLPDHFSILIDGIFLSRGIFFF
jgi:hypothetical protein